MAIENKYVGAWKVLVIDGISYIVEDAKETATQDIQAKKYVQGTVLPRVLNISGSTGEITVTAPLLVYKDTRASVDSINDGLRLWSNLFDVTTMMSPTYSADPGFIMSSAKFSLSATEGAKYTITLKGDASALGSEAGSAPFWDLQDGSDLNDPFGAGGAGDGIPFRVATFYDIVGSIGNPPIIGLMESLDITVTFATEGFNYIGQRDQNKVWAISSAEIKFNGNMISSQRAPAQGDFAWQALLGRGGSDGGDPPVYDPTGGGWGGITTAVTGGLTLGLRTGAVPNPDPSMGPIVAGLDILPGISFEDIQVVFDNSSVNITPGFLKSSFSGQAWITTRTLTPSV